jgi:hypothetical protein
MSKATLTAALRAKLVALGFIDGAPLTSMCAAHADAIWDDGPGGGGGGGIGYTTTTAGFTMPASGAAVTVAVTAGSASVFAGQPVFVSTAGFFTAAASGADAVALTNLGYAGNAAAGTAIASGVMVVPSGLRGETGPQGIQGPVGPGATYETIHWPDAARFVDTGTTLPAARRASAWYGDDDCLYIFGGLDSAGNTTDTIYRASAAAPSAVGAWTAVAGKTLPRANATVMAMRIGDYIYTFGGITAGTIHQRILRAAASDPTTWTDVGATGFDRRLYSAAIVGEYVYIFGGFDGTGVATNTILRAPVSSPTTWSSVGTLPAALRFANLVVVGPHIILYGGANAASAVVSTIYAAKVSDPLTWWDTGRTLPVPLAGNAALVIGSTVHLVGGATTGFTATRAVLTAPIERPWEVSQATTLGHPDGEYLSAGQFIAANGYCYLMGGTDATGTVRSEIYRSVARTTASAEVTTSATLGRLATLQDGSRQVQSQHQRSITAPWHDSRFAQVAYT